MTKARTLANFDPADYIPASGDKSISGETLFTGRVAGTSFVPVTFGASIALDLEQGNRFDLTLTGDATLENPVNVVPGQSFIVVVRQDPTGGHVLSFGSNWNFARSVVPILTSDPSSVDVIVGEVVGSGEILGNLIPNMG